jgi:hypothetical protein
MPQPGWKTFFGEWVLIRINGRACVGQDAFAFALQVVELAGVDRPAEQRYQAQHQQDGERDQEVQDVHRGLPIGPAEANWRRR